MISALDVLFCVARYIHYNKHSFHTCVIHISTFRRFKFKIGCTRKYISHIYRRVLFVDRFLNAMIKVNLYNNKRMTKKTIGSIFKNKC